MRSGWYLTPPSESSLCISVAPEALRQEPEERHCPKCLAPLNVRNTRTRTIVTSDGYQEVTEVTKHCSKHLEEVFRPSTRLTPPKSKYGYDIIAEIGKLRFLEHKQISEIHDYFRKRCIDVPERTIENLCHLFLQYVVAVHLDSLPKLGRVLGKQGGYVLHIDATTTKGTPGLLLMRDHWSGIRLLATSIPTEATEHVAPHLETLQRYFGDPIAAIRDMGKGIETAIIETFPSTYVITCHYHFLRDVGVRLFDKIYARFQSRVDRTGIKKKLRTLQKQFIKRKASEDRDKAVELLDYILAYRKDGNGIAFPFSLPAVDFYRRCEEVRPKVRKAIVERARDNICSPCLTRLENALNLLKPPPAVHGRIHADYLKLLERWNWFERIRSALRYRNGTVPLNTDGFLSNKELEKGRKMIDKLQNRIGKFVNQDKTCHDRSLKRILRGISELITERRAELFVPNVAVDANGRRKIKRLPRTNNSVEQDFRSMRRHARRIRGDMDVERGVQKDGVGLAIVANLDTRDYVRCVYGRLDQMATRFSEVSTNNLEQAMALFRR